VSVAGTLRVPKATSPSGDASEQVTAAIGTRSVPATFLTRLTRPLVPAYSVDDSRADPPRPMNDRLKQLAVQIEAAKKAVLALESYIAQVREAIAQTQKAIEEAEALVATGDGLE